VKGDTISETWRWCSGCGADCRVAGLRSVTNLPGFPPDVRCYGCEPFDGSPGAVAAVLKSFCDLADPPREEPGRAVPE
jgi:hypothetical protein